MHKKPYIRIFGLTLLPVLLLLLLTLAPAARTATPHAPAQPQSVIDACGAITTPTTWTGGNVYSATNCYVSVAAGVTLTIEPGVIVKFGGACPSYGCAEGSIALRVDGTLIVSGTLEQPVVFTSVADDAHGGDTNGDGASAGASGQWYGIVFNSGSHGDLSHTWIGYAGSGVFNADLGYGRAQVDARGGDVQIRYTEIISGLRKGIYLEGVGITPVIEAVSVAGNVSNSGSADGYAIYQASINMQPTYSALTFSGNDRDEVTIGNFGESLTQSITLGGTNFGVACGYTLCQLSVPDGMTLTVQPGTLLDFGASYGLAVDGGGSLIAEGMPSQTITFTSQLAAAGDAGQYWIGIWAQQGSTLHLDHCDISYANDSNYGLGGLEINTDDAQVLNCQIHHNKQNGLYVYSRDGGVIYPILTNVDITNNGEAGVYLNTSSGSVNAVTWDGGSIRDNGYAGVRAANIAGQGDIQLTLQNITISGNGTAGYAWNEPGIYANDHNTSLALENLTLINNVGAAVHWYCNGSITTRNLIATGNGADVLTLPGCTVSGGRQWDLGDAGIPVSVTGSIEVSTGGLLSIAPGTTLHFDKNQYGSPTALTVRDHAALY
ncbi:MAG: right-handed parallel beta-helix repeat-containing protein, partial [Anaerolineae bacterium]|nr:right-handed parallel beta-helix repeat-containing protein [Anaerolineae bacterium]